MSVHNKLSLSSAVLINLNVMVGAGIFINTVLLSKNAGGLGAFAYLLVGLLILPLIISMSALAKMHRGGTFYDYGANIHPYAGFLAIMSYFVAKLASCALAVHVCISLLQTIFPWLAQFPTLFIDYGVIAVFAALNTLNLRVGRRIQLVFMVCKFIPILFVIITGLYLFNVHNFDTSHLYASGIVTSVPFILYAFTGFEVSCSLSRALQNPERDGPRAMLFAYALGITFVCLFQGMFYGSLGNMFEGMSSYLQAFPALLSMFSLSPDAYHVLKGILHIGIAASALGAAYGIMYSNAWNLFEVAVQGHTIKQAIFSRLNQHQIPAACIVIEALIAAAYLFFSQGNQIPLQQILALGSVISYSLCVIGLLCATYRVHKTIAVIPVLGIMSCLLLMTSIVRSFLLYGYVPALIFVSILVGISCMFRSYDALDA